MGAVQVGVNENKGLYGMIIYLNKINFYPGETIIGEIKLYLKNNSQNIPQIIKNPTVLYTLQNREYWQNHDNKPSNITNSIIKTTSPDPISDEGTFPDDDNHLKEEILITKKEIYNNLPNNNIQTGISIPFQILIPQKAKPSLEFIRTTKLYAYSRTFLNIELPEYKNEAKLLIFIQKYPTPLKSELTIVKSVVKKKLGFLGTGNNVNFAGSYPKNFYGFNEICPINIKLDTLGAKEPIKSISVLFSRKVTFLQDGLKSLLFKFNEYTDDLWQNSMNSFEASQNFNFNIPLIENIKIFMQRKTIFFDLNSINKQNLICLLPSYEGELIKCEYFFKIKVSFESIFIKDPEFIMPIDLGHTPSLFVQNCMFDINKILNNYNGSLSMGLMTPDIFMNKNDKNNVQENIKKVFGDKGQNIFNYNKEQNFQNIPNNFYYNNINNSSMNYNINNNSNINNSNMNYNINNSNINNSNMNYNINYNNINNSNIINNNINNINNENYTPEGIKSQQIINNQVKPNEGFLNQLIEYEKLNKLKEKQ